MSFPKTRMQMKPKHNRNFPLPHIQRGVGLIEVMVAVLILGVGLLGIAAMQTTALRNSQSSLERSQAVMQTYAILDAMRAKDAEAVRSLMYRHIMHGADHLIQSLERAGTWGLQQQEAAHTPVAELPQQVEQPAAARAAPKAKAAGRARR